MQLGIIEKTPDEVLDYDATLTRWLASGDTVATVEATIEDSTAVIDSTSVTDDRVKVWLSGGVAGENGTLTLLATTAQGRTKEICFRLRVRDC